MSTSSFARARRTSSKQFFHRFGSISDDASQLSFSSTTDSMKRQSSHETLSLLSRSLTASSVNSSSTANTTFETQWLPESDLVKPETYKIDLTLTAEEIDLLRWSWESVTSNEAKPREASYSQTASVRSSRASVSFNAADFSSFLFCIQFYNNLMSMDDTIEEMIPSIRHQASAFAGIINYAIESLEDLTKMKDTLLNLGKLHSRILGIDAPYFRTMGSALMMTFRDWFGNDEKAFPLEMEEAWIKLYCFLANSIIQGGVDPYIDYEDAQESLTESDQSSTQPSSIQRTSTPQSQPAAARASIDRARAPSTVKPQHTAETSAAAARHPHKPATIAQAPAPAASTRASHSKKAGKRRGRKGKNGEDGDCIIM